MLRSGLAVLFATTAFAAAASVPVPRELILTVRETAGVARESEIVRSGVPLARSLDVRTTGKLAIVDAAGRAVPAEFEILGRWNAGLADASAPAQWLLVAFPASVDANGSAAFRLIIDGSVVNPAPAAAVRVTQNGTRFTIESGGATFVIDSAASSLFDEIRLGSATLTRGGTLTARANDSDTTYASTRRAFVEHADALSATIVVEGIYDLPPVGGGRLSSQRRYTFTAGSATAIVRQTLAWEGTLCASAGVIVCNGAPDAVRIRRVRDTLGGAITSSSLVTITGSRGVAPQQSAVSIGQTASIAHVLRANRTTPPRFELALPNANAFGVKADGALFAIGKSDGAIAVALDHMHRYEPQAMRVLEDGSLAIDVASDQVWLGARQGLFATFAVGAGLPAANFERAVWAPLNHPLRAWPSAAWFASSDAAGDVPVGALPAEFVDYDRAVVQALENTRVQTDAHGVFGLMTFGLFPRNWGNPIYSDEIDCFGGDPTPQESWDDLYWCSTWTDYHNTSMAAAMRAMRTGEVQWLDEISRPAALRQLYTQIFQCSPDDGYFYCGQAPAGYGGYRADFNSSHAYFDNLQLYYWLTGDRAVLETLERGARSMRNYFCIRRPASACAAGDAPVDEYANLTGRVASQWNAAYRFVGLAGDDASYLDDYRNNLGRAVAQQYLALDSYGFLLDGWRPVTSVSTHTTDQLWMSALYDMKNLDQLQRDTNDQPIGNPPVRPGDVLLRLARTLEHFAQRTSPPWPNQLDVTGSGPRIGGSIVSVRATPGGSDPLLYDTGKAALTGPLARAAVQNSDPALLALARELTRLAIAASLADNSPLGKSQGEYLARLHAAVANLSPPPVGRRRSVRK